MLEISTLHDKRRKAVLGTWLSGEFKTPLIEERKHSFHKKSLKMENKTCLKLVCIYELKTYLCWLNF